MKKVNGTYDLDFVMKSFLQSAEINYLSESLFNEELCRITFKIIPG
jgi:hypothetical protein